MNKVFSTESIVAFLLLCGVMNCAFADADIAPICSAAYPQIRQQMNQRVDEFNEMMAKSAKASDSETSANRGFRCAGIGVIDYHSAMDGELYYFNDSTHQLISICSMGLYVSALPDQQIKCSEICPPMNWRANNCDKEYSKYLKSQ